MSPARSVPLHDLTDATLVQRLNDSVKALQEQCEPILRTWNETWGEVSGFNATATIMRKEDGKVDCLVVQMTHCDTDKLPMFIFAVVGEHENGRYSMCFDKNVAVSGVDTNTVLDALRELKARPTGTRALKTIN